jgi:hypothetical protein
VTAPIRSGSGLSLLKLDDREELTADKLADARQQVRDLLLQKKAQERFDEWLEGLRRRAADRDPAVRKAATTQGRIG